MFRIPVKISTTEVIKLNARITSNIRQLSTGAAPPPPPPPPPPPGHDRPPKSSGGSFRSKLILATLGATAITGATLAYAKSNQEFRDILKEYAPWTDDAIALMYQERPLPGAWVFTSIKELANSASDMVFGSETKPTPAPPAIKPKENILAPIPPPKVITQVSHNIETNEPQKDKGSPPPAQDIKVVEAPPKVPEKSCLEDAPIPESANFAKMLEGYVAEATSAYNNGINVLQDYTQKVNTILEACVETGSAPWEELKRATQRKIDAECNVKAAIRKLDSCTGIKAERARAELSGLKQRYEKAKFAADVASKYWPQVEEARRHFVNEIEALFPRADISASKMDTRGGDPDALLLITLKKILLYQQQLSKLDCELSVKVDQSLKGTDEDVVRAKIEIALERERRELSLLFQKKMDLAKAASDKELRDQLKRQLDLHQAHLKDALDQHAEAVTREERKLAEERAAAERTAQGVKLAAVLGRLQGVDHALKARSDADKMARKAQLLWAACEALEGVLRGRGTKQTRVCVARELDAIASAAADSDELVATVLRGVPVAAREKGVLSEIALRDRFIKLEKVCRSLALVPECGGGLHVFLLSWLQGMLVLRPPPPPRNELLDEPTDFSKLDTYEILERTKYCVDRGQWGQALKYINLLQGAAGTVARDWAQEMALHLEARQAANALLAHAAASGLLHL